MKTILSTISFALLICLSCCTFQKKSTPITLLKHEYNLYQGDSVKLELNNPDNLYAKLSFSKGIYFFMDKNSFIHAMYSGSQRIYVWNADSTQITDSCIVNILPQRPLLFTLPLLDFSASQDSVIKYETHNSFNPRLVPNNSKTYDVHVRRSFDGTSGYEMIYSFDNDNKMNGINFVIKEKNSDVFNKLNLFGLRHGMPLTKLGGDNIAYLFYDGWSSDETMEKVTLGKEGRFDHPSLANTVSFIIVSFSFADIIVLTFCETKDLSTMSAILAD